MEKILFKFSIFKINKEKVKIICTEQVKIVPIFKKVNIIWVHFIM